MDMEKEGKDVYIVVTTDEQPFIDFWLKNWVINFFTIKKDYVQIRILLV